MVTRQERLLDAAIEVLGRHGMRGLTHRAVDASAGLAPGSTSNHFRTREALVVGVVGRLADRDRMIWAQVAADVDPRTPADLGRALAAFARAATGEFRTTTLARYAVFVEAGIDPRLQPLLAGSARLIRLWGSRWLAAVGSTHPERDAGIVLELLEGMIVHQLAFPDPDFDPTGRLTAVLHGVLRR